MNKFFSYLLFFLSCCVAVWSQPTGSPWNELAITGINKEKYHARVVPFEDLASALEYDYKKSPNYHSLNGIWKFKWLPSPKDTVPFFYTTKFDAQSWDNISVPGFIETQGFGTLEPDNTLLQIVNSLAVPVGSNPVGTYRTTFLLPETWAGREVFVNFDGVSSAFFLWINGQKAGYSENSFSPAEFDITKYLKPGENIVTLEVFRYSDGSNLETHNKNCLSGVFRDVYLYSTPKLQISDYKVETDLDENYNNATIKIKGEVRNLDKKDLYKYSVEFALYDAKGKAVFSEKSPLFSFAKTKSKTKGVAYEKLITAVRKWNSETPYLYTLVITMRSDKEKILEILSAKVGFREIEKKNGLVYLNGKRLLIKGIGIDEYRLGSNISPTEQSIKQDIFLLKQHNINAVFSRHPLSPLWNDLCDSYGIYICTQANLSIGGNTNKFLKDTLWPTAFMDRCRALVESNKNSTSVLLWSVGDIKNMDSEQVRMSSWAQEHDKTRITVNKRAASVLYPNISLTSDTSIQSILTGIRSESRPVIGLYDEEMDQNLKVDSIFALTQSYLRFQGVFCPGVDENGVYIEKLKEYKTAFKAAHISFQDTLFNKISIRNLQESINLNEYIVSWELRDNKNNAQSGVLKPDIPTDEEKEIVIPYKKALKPGSDYILSVSFKLSDPNEWAGKGFEVSLHKLHFTYNVIEGSARK